MPRRESALSVAVPGEPPLEPLSRVRGTAFPLAVICHFSSSTLLWNERFSQAPGTLDTTLMLFGVIRLRISSGACQLVPVQRRV